MALENLFCYRFRFFADFVQISNLNWAGASLETPVSPDGLNGGRPQWCPSLAQLQCEILKVEKLVESEGKTVEFKNVLFLNDDKTTEIGNPNIKGAKVEATILKNTKNKTILVFKKRRRKN